MVLARAGASALLPCSGLCPSVGFRLPGTMSYVHGWFPSLCLLECIGLAINTTSVHTRRRARAGQHDATISGIWLWHSPYISGAARACAGARFAYDHCGFVLACRARRCSHSRRRGPKAANPCGTAGQLRGKTFLKGLFASWRAPGWFAGWTVSVPWPRGAPSCAWSKACWMTERIAA